MSRRRFAIAGWGVVAPRSPDIEAFAKNLDSAASWLSPFHGFGPDNFLVGRPELDFSVYRRWFDERFPPRRYAQIVEKLGAPTQLALAAFIQALGQNPGLEAWLQELGTRAHVYVGTGLGDLDTVARNVRALDAAQARWDSFWEGRGEELERYLRELAAIEAETVDGEVESGKRAAIRRRQTQRARLQERWGAPEPPWNAVGAELLWNIHNGPASQVSMVGGITGLAFAPVGACSTFGLALKLALDAIERDEADAVVVGAADPPPLPLVVGGFYRARVLAADGAVSKPLTQLKGTHVAGGSVVWIVADLEKIRERGFRPLGAEPLAVGVSSDADHVITPSTDGPLAAIRQALARVGLDAGDVETWDLHATATPGDVTEVETLRSVLPETVWVTARKGTFGHGMAAGGGWELTAQYLGLERGVLFPTVVAEEELHPAIAERHRRFVFDTPGPAVRTAGKLSMGVGGINACVLSRAWSDAGS
ncbi:MAG: beta-ketoacyl synthase N-terminal-like domain-containing protein [Thermoanaerobaculia bacterium]